MKSYEKIVALAFIALVAGLSIYLQKPPEVVGKDAPADQFSAERAMVHVREIAARPHPTGSPEAAGVRDYVRSQLKAMGVETEILTSEQIPGESILGTIRGTQPGPAVMLASHYDSVPAGPGAGDDAAGVGAILETVRALKDGPRLRNDVMVLITDGEERGLFGAMVFVEDFERVRKVGLVLNFEGRGNRGPSYMFETSDRNGWLIREFAKAAPHRDGDVAGVFRLQVHAQQHRPDRLQERRDEGPELRLRRRPGALSPAQRPAVENLDPRVVQHQGDMRPCR